MTALTAALAQSPSGHYLTWGVIQISLTNALIVLAMVVVFVLALVVPFPHPKAPDRDDEGGA